MGKEDREILACKNTVKSEHFVLINYFLKGRVCYQGSKRLSRMKTENPQTIILKAEQLNTANWILRLDPSFFR